MYLKKASVLCQGNYTQPIMWPYLGYNLPQGVENGLHTQLRGRLQSWQNRHMEIFLSNTVLENSISALFLSLRQKGSFT